MIIWPSIASSNLLDLRSEIKYVDDNYNHIHIDIEDGNYIPNISFGTKLMELICNNTKSKKSIHLMVTSQEKYIESIKRCGPEIVFIHLDNQRYPTELIRKFQDEGIEVGVAFNPNIGIDNYNYVIPLVDNVLLMMCEPDGRGQQYIKAMEDKIKVLSNNYNVKIWLDGAIHFNMLPYLQKLNVYSVVMGRSIFNNRMLK